MAETLITLAIIGVVAALTIPTVIRNYQEKQTVTKVKKAYSVLSQAFNMAVANNGTPDTWNIRNTGSGSGATLFLNKLAPYLKISKNYKHNGGYTYKGSYLNLKGGNWWMQPRNGTYLSTLELADGTSLFFYFNSSNCKNRSGNTKFLSNICGAIYYDINSKRPPNTLGKDVFTFAVTKYGITPSGGPEQTNQPFSTFCKKDISTTSVSGFGYACTAWVIQNNNMDYLKCEDLSWDGKRKCD